MGQRIDRWQRADGDRRWLVLLIDAMEDAARPEVRAQPVEREILNALRAQLTRPAARYVYAASAVRH